MDDTQVSGGALPTTPVDTVAPATPPAPAQSNLPSVADYAKDYTTSRKAVQEANDALMQALNKRLTGSEMSGYKAIQGFLAPTKTGSFGESLGNVAALLSEDENKSIEIAKMRAELAQRSFDQNRKMLAQGLVMDSMAVPEATANAIVSSGGAVPLPVATGLVASGKLNPQFILQVRQFDKETAEGLNEAFKQVIELRKLAIEERKAGIPEAEFIAKYGVGYQDLLPGGKLSTTGGTGGTGGSGGAGGKTPSGVDVTSGEPISVQVERKTSRAKEAGKGEGERESAFFDRIGTADDRIVLGNALYTTVSQNPNAVGLLQHPGISNAIGKFFQEGVQAGQFGSFNIPVEELLRVGGKKATPENIRAAELIKSYVTQLTLEAQKGLYKGQGSVTENERRLAQQMTGSASNTAEFLKYSAAKILVNAEFDKRLAEEFNKVKTRMSYDDFLQSRAYKDIRAEQNLRLLDLSNHAITGVGLKPMEPSLSDKLLQERLNRRKSED